MKPNQQINEPKHVPVEFSRKQYILGFLNFHRRTIFGAVLLVAVAAFLLNIQRGKSRFEEDPYPDAASIDSSSQPETAMAPALDPSLGEGLAPTISAPIPIETSASADIDERINELLDTGNNWASLSNTEATAFLKNRIAELRELLQVKDLRPRQRNYCEHNLIESVGLMTGLSRATDAGVEGIDKLVFDLKQKYGASEDPEIAAVTNVVFIRYLSLEFVAARSDETFEALKTGWLENQASIFASKKSTEQVAKVFNEAIFRAGDDARLRKIGIDLMSQVVDLKKTVAAELALTLFFSKLDLPTLSDRVNSNDPSAEADMDLVLKQLAERPDMPVPIYSHTLTSIARFKDLGKVDESRQYLEQVRKIAPAITIERIRNEVLKGIEIVEAR